MASINDLKSLVNAKKGFARPNQYRVFLPTVNGLSPAEANLLCKNVELPTRQILTSERQFGMTLEKVPYGHAVVDINMTFLLLNDYATRKYFEAWQNLAINQETLEAGYMNEYAKEVTVQQLDNNSNIVYAVVLQRAFPTTIGSIQLGNDVEGIVTELNVQMSYTNWKRQRQGGDI
jgi:hypothetical protein